MEMTARGRRKCSDHAQTAPHIAIVGQPNTGKSTIFNLLTHGKQHTANWSGKTVEPQEGVCRSSSGETYTVVDLPGVFSLSPHSDRERVACAYLQKENPIGIVLVLDGSQLSRSMYLLTDFMGLNIPIVIVVTMIDILKFQRRDVDFQKLEIILGVPVIPVIGTHRRSRAKIIAGLERLMGKRPLLCCEEFTAACKKITGEGSDALRIAGYRHKWIRDRLMEICACPLQHRPLNKFDHVALHPVWGIILAFFFLFSGFAISAVVAGRLQHFLQKIANFGVKAGGASGIPPLLAEILNGAIFPGLTIAAYLLIFVGVLTLVIGIMEDVGYVARIAYLFDGLMGRIGLQGKCVIPFISGFGCTVAGVCGARVIDCPHQRRLTIAACWVVPCSGTWGTVGFVAVLFFGSRAVWVILGLFLLMILHIILTTRIFRNGCRSMPAEMLMDLPHYHRPHWRNIFGIVFRQMGQLLFKSIPAILLTAFLLWSFLRQFNSMQTDVFTNQLARFSAIFGLHWKLFVALALSLINRESALGGIAVLFGETSYILSAADGMLAQNLQWASIGTSLVKSVSPQGALAFLCAFFLSPPCCAAIAVTAHEIRSYAWTLRLLAYYFLGALLAAAIISRAASLFF
ncbi:MAG: ferrous iron transporter B [Puniceicoccales bacterium]|jgi:ferrous iron transport protein B|nr:ferrous iron transporter B [Puniceicoccales bacterium]